MARARQRQRLDIDERRRQLIALGRHIFNSRPYDEISIDDIAHAAGISKGLIYHYFESKRRFYVETIRAAFDELRIMTEPDPSLPPLEQLEKSLDGFLDYIEAEGEGYENLLRSGVGSDPEVQALVEQQRQMVIQRVLRSLGLPHAPPTIRMALRGWIGFIDAACLDWVQKKDVNREAVRTLLSNSLQAALLTAVQTDPVLSKVLPPLDPAAPATETAERIALSLASANVLLDDVTAGKGPAGRPH